MVGRGRPRLPPGEPKERRCTICEVMKDRNEFYNYPSGRVGGITSECKSCNRDLKLIIAMKKRLRIRGEEQFRKEVERAIARVRIMTKVLVDTQIFPLSTKGRKALLRRFRAVK